MTALLDHPLPLVPFELEVEQKSQDKAAGQSHGKVHLPSTPKLKTVKLLMPVLNFQCTMKSFPSASWSKIMIKFIVIQE